jgi:hypothetical protein
MTEAITIRQANGSDELDLRKLAALDDHNPIGGEALLAFVGGELRAAVALEDGEAVADPFRRTAELVELLRFTAAQRVA